MYCPNCGQSQPSEEVRYCSRCGLSLWELARWLMDGVNAPWNPVQPATEPSPRKKGIRRGAKLLFIGGVLLPITFLFALAINEPGPLVVPSLILFVGLVWMLYCRLFADDKPSARKQIPAPAYRPNEYLPPAHVNPANVLRPREPNAAEIVQPPSVTEYTTNLLKKRDQR
jgi:hypothetical protein